MAIQLYFSAIAVLSVELLFIGSVVGFYEEKLNISDILKLIIASVAVSVFIALGQVCGNAIKSLIGENRIWYGATILFIVGLKMIYNKVKLGKAKRLINPLEIKGLFVLAVLLGINAFFVGLAFGLINKMSTFYLSSLIILVLLALAGYYVGHYSKKMIPRWYEFLSGIVFIVIAIIITSNI